jgi:hypothetical protein
VKREEQDDERRDDLDKIVRRREIKAGYREQVFQVQWTQAVLRNRLLMAVAGHKLIKVCQRAFTEHTRRTKEAKYMANIMWRTMKMVMKL